jgi:HTH-type transcriptional repressor of NAD biosynthesis genes
MFKTGLVIGKFYPPHHGHKFLIDTAQSRVDHLTIIVCDEAGQTIPGPLRAAWLREIHPQATVLCIDDHYGADDSALWARLTVEWLGSAPDAVFTSEEYGARYAALMGSAHIQVDRERAHVPCSGTLVRADPLACWHYLEPCVRAYFARRVCIVGAESTGKTTLAQALADHYHTAWVPEYGREFTAVKLAGPEPDVWRSEGFTAIAAEQSRREDRAARDANRVLICDTDAFATSIWHERYMGVPSGAVLAIAAPRRYDLYLLPDTNVPFVQDGLRDGEHIRQWMHDRFVEELRHTGRPYALLSGDYAARMRQAIELIDGILNVTAQAPVAGSPGRRAANRPPARRMLARR